MTSTAVTVATLVGQAGDIVSEGITWVGETATAITSSPLILMFVLFGFVGTGIGLVRRMMRM